MAHWIDNADSYICSNCGYETNNPEKEERCPWQCPRCGVRMDVKGVEIDAVKPTKLDSTRLGGCFICKGETYMDGDVCISGTHYVRLSQFNFCPDCGRPLTEEAWAALKKREEDNETD